MLRELVGAVRNLCLVMSEDDLTQLAERLWSAGPRNPLDPENTWANVAPHIRKVWMRVAAEAAHWCEERV